MRGFLQLEAKNKYIRYNRILQFSSKKSTTEYHRIKQNKANGTEPEIILVKARQLVSRLNLLLYRILRCVLLIFWHINDWRGSLYEALFKEA